MAYCVEVTPAAQRDLRKLDAHIRKQVNLDLLGLEENPRPHGVEKMETKEKLHRVPVGPGKDYRAIYQIRAKFCLSW